MPIASPTAEQIGVDRGDLVDRGRGVDAGETGVACGRHLSEE